MTYLTQLFIMMTPFMLFTVIKGTTPEQTLAIIISFAISEFVLASSADQRAPQTLRNSL